MTIKNPYNRLYLVKGCRDLTRWKQRHRFHSHVKKRAPPKNNGSNGSNSGLTQIPKNFDISIAVELMQLSIYAYDQYTDFKNNKVWSIPDSSYSLVKTLYSTSEKDNPPIGFIATKLNKDNVKVIYVSWRGTQGFAEWMHDADFTQTEFLSNNGPKVEKGFYDLYTITNNISNPPPRQIVIDYLNDILDNLPKNSEMVNIGFHKYASGANFVRWDLKGENDHSILAQKRLNKQVCILKENINPCSLAYILTLKGAKNMVSFFEKTGFLRATDGNFNDYLQTKNIFYGSTTVLVTGNSDLKSDIFIH